MTDMTEMAERTRSKKQALVGVGRWMARCVAVLSVLSVFSVPADAQFFAFGQNKVQYRKLDWKIIRGPHVDLYYYPAEAELAPAALAYAEASYDTLALQFGHEVGARIPLIVYASHTDFEQTNILPFTPPEGLLGVTDFLKRRVALPFRGNFSEFRHTLRHEMVHAFQLDLQSESYNQAPRSGRFAFPLWWTEGLAELWSGGEDARDMMVLRDITFTGRLPQLRQLTYVTSGIVYPLGGRIHRWLADTYGDWRVATMYKELNRYDTFEDAVHATYGRSLDQLSEEFQLAMRRDFYPSIDSLAPLAVLGREITRLAIKPAFLPDSGARDTEAGYTGEVLFTSPATGYATIYRKRLGGGKPRKVLVGGRTADLEAFHPFDSRMDASRPGFLLLAARYGDRDALVIWDLKKGKLAGRYQFDRLNSILSPMWMPDRQSIVFSGLSESGVSDLYRVRLPQGTLEPLTHERFQDLDPSPHPDGRRLVFASDRTAGGLDGAVNLFLLDLRSGTVSQLTRGTWVDETPSWGPDGRVYFTSNRDGVLNVFSVDTLGQGRRETSAWSGAFDAVPLPDSTGLLIGGFHDLSWNLYRYPVDSAARQQRFSIDSGAPPAQWTWGTRGDTAAGLKAEEPYRRRLTLDVAAGDAVFIPGYGGAQGIAFLMSDLLGDNLIFGSIGSFHGRRLGSVFENINASAVYLNRQRRLNWGVGAFRTKGRNFEGDNVVAYNETAIGGLALLRYPLSRFSRIEGTVVVEHSNRVDFTLPVDEPRRIGWLASHYLSYVHDNSLWISSGPIDGTRFSLTGGISSDFTNSRFDSYLLSGDWRRYFRTGRRSTYAVRALGFYSGGDRPRRINIGGTLGLRGYPQFGYILGSHAFMVNQELRFPVLTHFTLGTPFGDVDFPEIQGALFADVGKATFPTTDRALLGSYGLSFRLAIAPLAVLRLDLGRRFTDDNYIGYSLNGEQKRPGFLSFFFGYNY
ncbi:MAG: PD40 domain-containing protein [Gemmatimonadales bacterium]|nr:PD40 domain-containing protein [Gemmatimonadales bacterium]